MRADSNNRDFKSIFSEELKVVFRRRCRLKTKLVNRYSKKEVSNEKDIKNSVENDTNLIGLSLSGGGIRSALLNLGVLQELSRLGLLKVIDFLSTISGGGYIGGCLSSLLSIREIDKLTFGDKIFSFLSDKDTALFSTSWENFPFRDHPLGEKPFSNKKLDNKSSKKANHKDWCAPFYPKTQMKHLRNYSNYLIPGNNFYEFLKSCGALLLNFIYPFLWFLSILTLIVISYMWLISFVSQKPHTYICMIKSHIVTNILIHFFQNKLTLYLFTIAIIQTLIYFYFKYRKSKKNFKQKIHRLDNIDKINLTLTFIIILGFILIYKNFYPIVYINRSLPYCFLLIPVLYSIFMFLISFLLIIFFSVSLKDKLYYILNDFYLFMSFVIWFILFGILFVILPNFIKSDINIIIKLAIELFIIIVFKLLLKIPVNVNIKTTNILNNIISALSSNPKIRNIVVNILTIIFLLVLIIIIGNILDKAIWNGNWLHSSFIKNCYLYFTIISLVILSFVIIPTIDLNQISDHSFYKKRLSEAFLQTSIRCIDTHVTKIVRNSINMNLKNLHGVLLTKKHNKNEVDKIAARGPYHIITATLNLTSTTDLKGLRRKSEPFMFSRLFIGSQRTGYVKTTCYPDLTLSTAMTISGAAIAPVMGKMTNFATSFFCTLLGGRLGYWLENPKYLKKQNKSCNPIRYWLSHLFHEFIGMTNADNKYIYLSDGGHCGDNLGILPLLKRRVKLIIASDAEHDPEFTFESLNNSLRQIYIDEGIKITLEKPYKYFNPDNNGFTKTHFLIGRILYPDRPWQASWIIVLKSSLTGDEIAPILNYKRKSKSFPNETTTNQFFTEEQFESYRALGRHIVESSFSEVVNCITKSPNPWQEIDTFCRNLLASRIDCNLNNNLQDTYELYRWDDLFCAMWDCENIDFSSWHNFKNDVEMLWKDVEKRGTKLKDDILIKQLIMLYNWLNKQKTIDTSIPLPKTLKEFYIIKKQTTIS